VNVFPEGRARLVVEGALDEDLGGYPGLDVTSSATIPAAQRSSGEPAFESRPVRDDSPDW